MHANGVLQRYELVYQLGSADSECSYFGSFGRLESSETTVYPRERCVPDPLATRSERHGGPGNRAPPLLAGTLEPSGTRLRGRREHSPASRCVALHIELGGAGMDAGMGV